MDIGGLGGKALLMFGSWFVWVGILIFLAVFGIIFFYIRRKAKFTFPTVVVNQLGGDKGGFEYIKSGWFKSKKIFGGLWEVGGERRLETDDGRVIWLAGTDNFHEIRHRRGLVCYAKPDDPKILIPINNVLIDGKDLVMKIAPANYRECSANILTEATEESKGLLDKILPVITYALIGIVLFICIMFIVNMVKSSTAEIHAMTTEALNKVDLLVNKMSTLPASAGAK